MHQPDQEGREAPSSLPPVQVERGSDEQDLAGMRGRRGPRILFALVVLAAIVFGGVQLLASMDARQAYSQAVAQLERSEVDQREAFMRCALPNQQRSPLGTESAALQSAIEMAAERMGRTYAKVLTKCTPLLESFQQAVASIEAPADAAPSVRAVSQAANAFAAAWLALRDSVEGAGAYEPAQAAPRIQAITSSWGAYQTARAKAKEVLSARM